MTSVDGLHRRRSPSIPQRSRLWETATPFPAASLEHQGKSGTRVYCVQYSLRDSCTNSGREKVFPSFRIRPSLVTVVWEVGGLDVPVPFVPFPVLLGLRQKERVLLWIPQLHRRNQLPVAR